MKKIINLVFVFLLLFSTSSHSWVTSSNVKIKSIVQWEGDVHALLVLSNNTQCYIPLSEKVLYSFALALYMSGKSTEMHCHDTPETINGYANSHKVHRIVGN